MINNHDKKVVGVFVLRFLRPSGGTLKDRIDKINWRSMLKNEIDNGDGMA
jgi:hypothetical protein